MGKYKILVVTGDSLFAGSPNLVQLWLVGEHGEADLGKQLRPLLGRVSTGLWVGSQRPGNTAEVLGTVRKGGSLIPENHLRRESERDIRRRYTDCEEREHREWDRREGLGRERDGDKAALVLAAGAQRSLEPNRAPRSFLDATRFRSLSLGAF